LGHCGAWWPAAKRRLGKVLDTENIIRALIQPFGLKVGQVSMGKLEPTCES
jgi:hypothetical protein